jgi:hypothetical protein
MENVANVYGKGLYEDIDLTTRIILKIHLEEE